MSFTGPPTPEAFDRFRIRDFELALDNVKLSDTTPHNPITEARARRANRNAK